MFFRITLTVGFCFVCHFIDYSGSDSFDLRGRCGCYHMGVGFTTTCAKSTYQLCVRIPLMARCIRYNSMLQVGGLLWLHRFFPPINLTTTKWLKYFWKCASPSPPFRWHLILIRLWLGFHFKDLSWIFWIFCQLAIKTVWCVIDLDKAIYRQISIKAKPWFMHKLDHNTVKCLLCLDTNRYTDNKTRMTRNAV